MRQQKDSLWTSYPNFTFQVTPAPSRAKSFGCVPLGSSRTYVKGGLGGATLDGAGSRQRVWAEAVVAIRKSRQRVIGPDGGGSPGRHRSPSSRAGLSRR